MDSPCRALRSDNQIRGVSNYAETIRGRGGDYLLALKANRPLTLAEVETYFADPPPGGVETHQTVDADHGRIETRRHTVCHQVDWLFSDRKRQPRVALR